jgi:hypothetical protein
MAEGFTGGCACGAVRYRMTSAPMFVNCCHCRDCQRQTGTAFVINGIIETSRIDLLQGEPKAVGLPTDSGRPHDVYRCPECQTALWSDYGGRAWVRFLRIGTLDEPHAFKPDAHIFTTSKVPWVRIPEDQPAFDIYYEMAELWSADSLARREAAIAASRP